MAGRQPEQELKPWDRGRKGYREPDEPVDERLVLKRSQFWKDETERLTYEHAAEKWPRKTGEGMLEYIERLAARAQSKLSLRAPLQTMPPVPMETDRVRLPYRDDMGEDG